MCVCVCAVNYLLMPFIINFIIVILIKFSDVLPNLFVIYICFLTPLGIISYFSLTCTLNIIFQISLLSLLSELEHNLSRKLTWFDPERAKLVSNTDSLCCKRRKRVRLVEAFQPSVRKTMSSKYSQPHSCCDPSSLESCKVILFRRF